MQEVWIVKRIDPPAAAIHSIQDSYVGACFALLANSDASFSWSNEDDKGNWHKCTVDMPDGYQQTWQLEEATLLTKLTVTFSEIETLIDYEFTLRITHEWIDIHGVRHPAGAGGEFESKHVSLGVEAFDKWVQADPMFNPADFQGMINYACRVHQAPKWFNKFKVR